MKCNVARPRLIVLSDFSAHPSGLERMASLCAAARPGSVALVLRDRQATARERLAWGQRMRDAARRHEQLFFVSDRLDLAFVLSSDGVHLPAQGLCPAQVRGQLPTSSWVSRAIHDVDCLTEQQVHALSAVLVSPVYKERKGRDALGLAGLRQRIAQLQARAPLLQIFALGGVTHKSAAACLTAGASGVAVIGAALQDGADHAALLEALEIAGVQQRRG